MDSRAAKGYARSPSHVADNTNDVLPRLKSAKGNGFAEGLSRKQLFLYGQIVLEARKGDYSFSESFIGGLCKISLSRLGLGETCLPASSLSLPDSGGPPGSYDAVKVDIA